ncbi:MAG: hypothetical protein ACTSRG_20185 [Candidatus Helarchaeota archaeon]
MTEYVNRTINFSTDLFEYLEVLTKKYDMSKSKIIRKILKGVKENPELTKNLIIGDLISE